MVAVEAGRSPPSSPVHENGGIEEPEGEGLIEMHDLTQSQAMSVATSDDSDYDDSDNNRWGSMGILRNTSSDYEYNYLDEDVYVGRGYSFLIPSGKLRWCIALFLLASIAIVFAPRQAETEDNPVVRKYKGAPQYVCPSTVASRSGHKFAGYANTTDLIATITNNFTLFEETFRSSEYRNWGKSYNEVKESLRGWVIARYTPALKTGDSIFESSCGIGLNLLMTLEILQDNDVRDLHLYGSTFEAAQYANLVVEGVLTASEAVGSGKRGVICSADSVDLGFVPDNSFDLVFSGHISPERDIWMTKDGDEPADSADSLSKREAVCSSQETDWRSDSLVNLAQVRQNDWYGRWVAEMVRIAKPGAPVIIQNVLTAYCEAPVVDPLGAGVSSSFWNAGVETFGWDVDPTSIEFEFDSLFPNNQRYHVVLKKTSKMKTR